MFNLIPNNSLPYSLQSFFGSVFCFLLLCLFLLLLSKAYLLPNFLYKRIVILGIWWWLWLWNRITTLINFIFNCHLQWVLIRCHQVRWFLSSTEICNLKDRNDSEIMILVLDKMKLYWVEQASSQKVLPFPEVGNGASGVERESFSGSTVFIRWQSVIGECVLLTMTILGPGNVPLAYFSGSRCIPLSSALAVDEISSRSKIKASILTKRSYLYMAFVC